MKKRFLLFSICMGISVCLFGCGASNEVVLEDTTDVVSEVKEETAEEKAETDADADLKDVSDDASSDELDSKEEDNTPESLYKTVLDDYYSMLVNNAYEEYAEEWDTGITEVCMYSDPSEVLDKLGYYFEDLNNDGTPELMLGQVTKEEDQYGTDTILVLFSIVDGEPKAILSGWGRSCQYLSKDKKILNSASGGASIYGFSKRYLDTDGIIQTEDFYFTDYDSMGMEDEIDVYYNKTSEWDKSLAEKIDMTADELYDLSDKEINDCVFDIPYTPFSLYGSEVKESDVPVKITFAEGKLDRYSDHIELVISSGEYKTQALIVPKDEISNVTVYSITYEDVDEDGNFIYSGKELSSTKIITKDCPLVVTVEFIGSIPNNGITFEDKDGKKYTYAIAESGKDGSLLLEEITLK